MPHRHARILPAVTLAALLAACGGGEPNQPVAAAPTATPVQATAGTAAPAVAPTTVASQIVLRWNDAASQSPVDLPAPFGRTSFNWDGTHFPHPTFKGGSAEAYGAFAHVLLAFLQSDGTFDLLAAGGFFTQTLPSGVPGPVQGPGTGWTLKELVSQFGADDSFGTHDKATRAALRAIAQRIEAVAPTSVAAPDPPVAPPAGLVEAVSRWNATADRFPVSLPAPFGQVTFRWDGTTFPHPTFKGGSAEAYGAFANVLLAFLDGPGTLDLLASNRLLRLKLRSGAAGPAVTFANLAATFGSPDAFGTHDAATRAALAAISRRIDVIVAQEDAPTAGTPAAVGR